MLADPRPHLRLIDLAEVGEDYIHGVVLESLEVLLPQERLELGAVVIPFITGPTPASVSFALDGLEDCHAFDFSTKGCVDNVVEHEALKQIVHLTVDTLDLRTIVVYDVCKDNAAVDDIFAYARDHGVEVVVPMNTLKARNIVKTQVVGQVRAEKAEGGEGDTR